MWFSARRTRPPLTREQAREAAARAFRPMTAEAAPPEPGQPRPSRSVESTYKPGDRVSHPTFGTGIVVAVRADASAEIVDVNFAGGAGIKKLDVAFAPLSRA
jgi:DNA helicase-2/ATP-dependent DNA helicase PcrA